MDLPRSDARAKITGRALYTQDHYPQGMLHGVVVRSAIARGCVVALRLEKARSAPGVLAVLGPDDVPDRLFGDVEPDEPMLASDDVRFAGQPIALVAANSREQALAAAALVEVTYDELEPVVTLVAAIAPDAPQVRRGQSNVLAPSRVVRGDAAAAFERSDVTVIETSITSQRAHQGYIELRSALAEIDQDGHLVVTMTSQAPYQVRASLASIFDLPLTDVVVRVPTFGGGFGGKLHQGMAPYAAALALATRRPVQVVCPRGEDMQASNPRESSLVTVASAVTKDGTIVGRRVKGYFDSGAYVVDTPYITAMGAMQAVGPYAVDAVVSEVHAVSTNLQPTGSFRSPSGPQMAFALERHMDTIARDLGLDPVELRRRNLVRDGSLGPTGQILSNPPIAECIDAVERQLAQWRKEADATPARDHHRHGFGLAAAWWFTAPGASAVHVRMEDDGGVTVHSGAVEIGTGAVVSGVRALVAQALSVDPSVVRVVNGGTRAAPADFGSEGSRTLYGAGSAAIAAIADVKAALAAHLEVDVSDVDLDAGMVGIRGVPTSMRPLGDVVREAGAAAGPVVGRGRFQAQSVAFDASTAEGMLIPAFHEPTFHCQGAWVEVDDELGLVRVRKYVAAHDVGHVIDWQGLKGQVEGGIVQGLGYALLEEIHADSKGRVINPNLVDYRLPTAGDVPDEIVIHAVVTVPSTEGPLGAKGIGEAPIILPGAVIAAAVEDAIDRHVTRLPIDPAALCLER
ncbi:xanthine dehydrogenase family protein molybdopterin-binding subunit [Nocardioides cavernae]|uniref:Xanthine dehydrogenase family protein molybdopterin-binding subunit n=1 Tax=Nocardioides cavernae TaxID=1921566 RepID=A0ABR8N8R4_9ACTN|nr:xanthine dehydrogenase family protein molybdopterin-binding subunit [Nocardioides cavernae]MBD3924265.1 xanthine dehydrogenase family protein molybdopterin-binding subunit [Nocardioides cavernae]MBM7510796.1 CO/xanthine dehydrogenase Mo-binding subunit [Nocardioides cavernae]